MTDTAYLMEADTSLQQLNVFRLQDCRVVFGKEKAEVTHLGFLLGCAGILIKRQKNALPQKGSAK